MEPIPRIIIYAIVMFCTGVVLRAIFPDFINRIFKSQIQIQEGNYFTKAWNKNSLAATLDVYLFDIENEEEFENGTKAQIRELGPYKYDLWLYKNIIDFNDDQTRVRYWEVQSYDIRPETQLKLKDKIRTLNFPVYVMANIVRNIASSLPLSFAVSPAIMGLVSVFLRIHGESLVKELTVDELLNGYRFTLLDTIETLAAPLRMFGFSLTDTGMPDNKFGYLWTKNHTQMGPFKAYTGQKGTETLDIIKYKDYSELPYYNDSKCNEIKGNDGSIYGVDVKWDKVYYVFTSTTCKTFDMIYQKGSFVKGIPTYRFIQNPKLFRFVNPLNKCYCTTPENEPMCDGLFDMTRCTGAPLGLSWPHFFESSSFLQNVVTGMSRAKQDKHQAFVDVEPFSGIPLRGYQRIQTNAILKPIFYLEGFRKLNQPILPLLWLQSSAEIKSEDAWKLKVALYPLYTIYILNYLLIYGGTSILIGSSVRMFWKRFIKNSTIVQSVDQNLQ